MKIERGLFLLIVGGLIFITLTSLVFAFMQQAKAKRQAALAIANERMVIECHQEAQKTNQQLSDQTQRLQLAVEEVAQKARLLEEQAAKSKNKK